MVVATILGAVGGWIVFGGGFSYFGTSKFALSALVGLVATPLAPIAKDLATSLQAAVGAASTLKPVIRR